MSDDTERRVTRQGKELLMDGRHLADCVSEEAAAVLALALNHGLLANTNLTSKDRDRVTEFFA